jgi:hypothetical protein
MKPIWYFVGLMLLIIGVILLGTGVYLLASPPEHVTILGDLHPDIWWGAVLLVGGLAFVLKNRKTTLS